MLEKGGDMNKQPEITEQTKKNIIDAFWRIFKKKKLDKITVKEITEVAGYNRSTFYAYFTSVSDILEQEEDILLHYIHDNASKVLFPYLVKGLRPNASELYFFTKSDYLKILLSENGDPKFKGKLKKTIIPIAFNAFNLPKDNIHAGYIFEFCFSAVISTIIHWYENQEILVDELFDILWTMVTEGVLLEYNKLIKTNISK